MLNKSKLIIAVSCASISLTAFAGGYTVKTEKPFYVQLSAGVATGPDTVNIKANDFDGGNGYTAGGTNASNSFNLSTRGELSPDVSVGYNLSQYFAVEADFSWWGRQGLKSVGSLTTSAGAFKGNLETYSYGINVLGKIPVTPNKLNVLVKLGTGIAHSQMSVDDPQGSVFFTPGNYSVKVNEAMLNYGAGIQYQFNNPFAVRVMWDRLMRLGDTRIGNVSYNRFSVGAIYNFG